MISSCPHCHQELRFTDAQRRKIESALAELPPGKMLKLACPQCRRTMELESGPPEPAGVLEDILYSGGGKISQQRSEPARATPPSAPQPPDNSWLAKGDFHVDEGWEEDVPTALILVPEDKGRRSVMEAFSGLGYQLSVAESSQEAMERLRFSKFSAIVCHVCFEEGGLAASAFHRQMREMGMDQRRYLCYVLIGPEFRTLYDLEALAHSANLVVNDAELQYLPLILKKALHDYHELFAPLIMILREFGKR